MTGVERRKPKWYQIILQAVIPILILAIVTWMASTTVELKVSVAKVETTVDAMAKALVQHNQDSRMESFKNSTLHHRKLVIPCTGCHVENNAVRE